MHESWVNIAYRQKKLKEASNKINCSHIGSEMQKNKRLEFPLDTLLHSCLFFPLLPDFSNACRVLS